MPETAPLSGAARQIGVKQPVWKMRLRPSEPAIDGRAHLNRFPDEEHRAALLFFEPDVKGQEHHATL